MKTNYVFFLTCIALLGTACKPSPQEPEPQPQPVQLDLIGTWRSIETNGEATRTNDRIVLSYISSTKKTMSYARVIPVLDNMIITWRNKVLGDYQLTDNHLVQDSDPGTTDICTATAIDAQKMRVSYDAFVNKQGDTIPTYDTLIYERVTDNLQYDDLILGLWEGVDNSGEETYGDYHHRWEYKPIDRSGFYTYVYYNYDTLNAEWVAVQQAISDYNVHGNWLATRWTPMGSSEMDYEWWDIDFITDSTMQWSALRAKSDGTGTFRATFSFRRVVE